MPARGAKGRPDPDDLPSTLERSPVKAQRTYAETLASARETYDGDEQRAHRAAYAALKHSFAKVGDHWEAKEHGSGPSDPQAAEGGAGTQLRTRGGVDENAPKHELYDQARELDIPGRSTMTKAQLLDALERASRSATRRAR